jgi:hypothetical protein
LRHERPKKAGKLPLLRHGEIGLLVLRLDGDEENRNRVIVKVINDPRTTPLARSTTTDSDLPQSARSRDQIAVGRLISHEIDNGLVFCRRQ